MLAVDGPSDADVARIAGADPASVKPASVPADSSHLNVVERGLETPHIPFSRPGALAPVKALFLVASTYGRDVVELAQRFDLIHDHPKQFR